jgi:conjugal transfer pilus assembly protein TrbC
MPLLASSLFGSSAAFAQATFPGDAQIEAQMAKQKVATEQALAWSAKVPLRAPKAVVAVPSISPPPTKTDDIMEIVNRYNAAQAGQRSAGNSDVDLMIFVSFSMPPDILKELSRQADEAGAVMVIRGFKDGKLSRTQQAIRAVNEAGAEWDIHPDAFKMFKIKTVPTFVVANANASSVLSDGCSPEVSYGSVAGNMSVDLALGTIQRRGSAQAAQMAETRLKLLQQRRNTGSAPES